MALPDHAEERRFFEDAPVSAEADVCLGGSLRRTLRFRAAGARPEKDDPAAAFGKAHTLQGAAASVPRRVAFSARKSACPAEKRHHTPEFFF